MNMGNSHECKENEAETVLREKVAQQVREKVAQQVREKVAHQLTVHGASFRAHASSLRMVVV